MQAYRKGSKRLILFDEVDVYTPIEHDVAGQKQVMPSIIRAANRKTCARFITRSGQPRCRTWQKPDEVSVPADFAL